MQPFNRFTGLVVPLDRANVDTDQIIPKQFLKSIHRTGFGDNLFDAWRYKDEGWIGQTPNERQINHDFVLNQARYQGASILLARSNFGCGSSREHAVWALQEFGIRSVIAPSFADIFLNNCFKNSVLPIVLNEEVVARLFEECFAQEGYELTVDLAAQKVITAQQATFGFAVDSFRKTSLLKGLDDIGLTLENAPAIKAFENRYREQKPWLFSSEPEV